MKNLYLLCFFLLYLPCATSAQTGGDSDSISVAIIFEDIFSCYGESIQDISITVYENSGDWGAFGSTKSGISSYLYDTIFLTAPTGFYFDKNPTLTASLSTLRNIIPEQVTKSILTSDSTILHCVFATDGTNKKDSITISGFKLTPTSDDAVSGGSIGVSVSLYGGSTRTFTAAETGSPVFSMSGAPNFPASKSVTQTVYPNQPISFTISNGNTNCIETPLPHET